MKKINYSMVPKRNFVSLVGFYAVLTLCAIPLIISIVSFAIAGIAFGLMMMIYVSLSYPFVDFKKTEENRNESSN